jgi:hypothetical protein
VRAGVDSGAHSLDAGFVARDPRLATLRGPTSVAIHDNRDVTRQTIPRNRSEKRLFARAFLNDG